ncbi:hypothetical protein ScPMuIL_009198 [Solemya velum]
MLQLQAFLYLATTIVAVWSSPNDGGSDTETESYSNKVLLISMDGFRWDYLNRVSTPNFDEFAKHGTRARFINNTFTTKTFPSHYSIATGLFEESHGIIGNSMYDPVFDETFSMRTTDSKWWGGEPIWITTRKQNLHSATYFWPGSEVNFNGTRPNIYMPYNQATPFHTRVDKAIDWLRNQDMNFVCLYFHEPDATGHRYGPNSDEVLEKVKEMDILLGYIVTKLQENNLADKVNVMVTSDHGMTELDVRNRVIDLNQIVNMSLIKRTAARDIVTHITPKDGQLENVYNALRLQSNMTVYHRKDLPDRWHYKNNRRVMPLVVVADDGWLVSQAPANLLLTGGRGGHGYDNALSSMKPIFLARGPNIKPNYEISPFLTVDIYPLVCELLNLNPAPNNGSLARTRDMLVVNPRIPVG